MFSQIATGSIDENSIHKDNKNLTIAVPNGLQGIKSFSNKSDSLNQYEKQLITFYPISENTYSIAVALIDGCKTKETPFLKTILRLIAENENGEIKFSIPLKSSTKKWKSTKVGNITYFYKDTIQLERARKFDNKNNIIS
ncbi:MAG: hypothetical protein ACI85I_002650, partial [Arenicella sp.]